MTCSSCNKQKIELHAKKSKLLPNLSLYMCSSCIEKKFEPRFTIVLAARNGIDVYDYVWNRRYYGDDILGKEILLKK